MNRKSINCLSLALNLALAVLCIFLALRRPAAKMNPTPPQTFATPSVIAEPLRVSDPAKKENRGRAESGNWIEILRHQGVPEKVIARLALADFEDRWQSRQAEAQQAYNRGDLDSDGLAALAREHDGEQEKDLRATLGDESFRHWDQQRLFEQFHLNNIVLTAGETNSVYDFAAQLRQRLRDLEKARQENQIDQATCNAEQAKAQADFEKQLRALLGDERYGVMRGENPAVGDLRRSLRGLDVDDGQFAALLQAQEQWEANRAQLEQLQVEIADTNLQPQILALADKRDEAIVAILGTNGLAQFQKQQDSRFLEMQKNAARWGLDAPAIDDIYIAIQTYERAADKYEREVRQIEAQAIKLDLGDLHQNLRKYGLQLARNLRTHLGDASYDAVRRNQLLPFDHE